MLPPIPFSAPLCALGSDSADCLRNLLPHLSSIFPVGFDQRKERVPFFKFLLISVLGTLVWKAALFLYGLRFCGAAPPHWLSVGWVREELLPFRPRR